VSEPAARKAPQPRIERMRAALGRQAFAPVTAVALATRCHSPRLKKAPAAFTAEVGATVTAGKGTTTALKLAAMGSGKGRPSRWR